MLRGFVRLLSLVGLAGLAGLACGAGPAITDPQKAGPDFAAQGEYVGEMERDGQTRKVGVQVIALGKGEFEAVVYPGGLPGDGWSSGDDKNSYKGQMKDGTVMFEERDNHHGELKDGAIKVVNNEGRTILELKKTERKSPTLEAKPPKDAIVLFDGKNTDAWKGGKIVEGKYLDAGTTSKEEFQDFALHLEFQTPFMAEARGQARGNSGMYLQNRYEVQVLDSFGLEGENNECGGIYQIAKPLVNMCFPPLSWQTYDVEMKGARFDASGKRTSEAVVTIKQNGVVIHDNLKLPKITPGGAGQEAPGKGPLFLQNHGDPVRFRNIWVVRK
jgi:3-keto-disaccharide hydrolase